ncbi:MAG: hypothetical protein ACPLYF_01580 [Fervidobacterium sp.]
MFKFIMSFRNQCFLLISILLLSGCISIGYTPPKYVCECKIYCNGQPGYTYTESGETKKEVVNNCATNHIKFACDEEEKNIKTECSPMTWEEWNKYTESWKRPS